MSYLNRTALALGRSTETAPLVEEAYQIARTAEDWFCVALALEHQALLCQRQERMDEAQQMLAEAHALDRQIGDDWSRSRVLIRLGQLALDNGDLAAAHQHFVDALQLAHHTALLAHALEALTGLASLLAVQGHHQRALTLAQAVMEHHASNHATRQRARQLQAALLSAVTPAELATIQQRLQTTVLDVLVIELLRI